MVDKAEHEQKSGLELHVGNEVAINCNSGQFFGVLHSISIPAGEIYLFPSLVYEADGKRMRIEHKLPTVISLGNFTGGKDYAIKALGEGYLREAVALSHKNSGKLGFITEPLK